LKGQINLVLKALGDKNFADSLKGVFAMDSAAAKLVENAKRDLQDVVEKLELKS